MDLGLYSGYQIFDKYGISEVINRKQARTTTFSTVGEIEEKEEILRELLQQTLLLNENRIK